MPLAIDWKSMYHGNITLSPVHRVHRLRQMFPTFRSHISLNIHWISIKLIFLESVKQGLSFGIQSYFETDLGFHLELVELLHILQI